MKYDSEVGRLLIDAKEYATIAKRGIGASTCDESDESELSDLQDLRNKHLPPDVKKTTFSIDSEFDSTPFTLSAEATVKDGIYLVKAWDSGSKAPSKDEIALARAEAFITAFLYAKSEGKRTVLLTIIYINRKNGQKITASENVEIAKLEKFYEKCKVAVAKYAKPEIERAIIRLPSMKNARFPYGKAREGQTEFMSLVYKNLTRGGTLYASAPTGTGKTVSALYPAVRALGSGKCDKVFYLTPKTTTAIAAKECIEELCRHGAVIKAVTIGAKDRVCRRGVLCRHSKRNCPSKLGENLINAVLELYESGISVVTERELYAISEKYCVCPHELSLTYSELCDVIILDVNYLFDPRVYIKRYFTSGGNFAFLIDEAHNLPDRAREMYSAEISVSEVMNPAESSLVGEHSALASLSVSSAKVLYNVLMPYVKDEMHRAKDGIMHAFSHVSEPPTELYELFYDLKSAAEAELMSAIRSKDSNRDERLGYIRDYLAKINRVSDTLDIYSDGFETFIRLNGDELSLKLFCIDPSRPISDKLKKGKAAVFFSATLSPISYYRSVLGGDRASGTLEIDSPFATEQLSVSVMDRISTRYSEREDTLLAVSTAIAACVSAKRGHYIIFSPSFAYSEALSEVFVRKYPKIKVMTQKREMSKKEKADFLASFEENKSSYLVAFCVMGGIYSEGIDLVGDSLIGAVIVGIGIPGLSEEREAIAAYYDEKCDEGKQYAYIYPGMNRVFQAAGRVIRREDDRGVIVLIDDRFADPLYKKSMPQLWSDMEYVSDPKALRDRLDKFWREHETT